MAEPSTAVSGTLAPAAWRQLLLPSVCLLALLVVGWAQRSDGRLHLYILETAGDAALIRTPEGRFVLVDGGRDPARLSLLLGRLMPFWQRELLAVVLTGDDGQRIPGQVAALSRYSPAVALANPGLGRGGFAGEWRRLAAAHRVRSLALRAGQRLELDGAALTVLATDSGGEGGAVLVLSYGETRIVFHTGGPAGDTAALSAAQPPVDLLVYPWQRDPTVISALRPHAIIFTEAYEAPAPTLLSYADRRRYALRVYHPKADGQIELVSNGRHSQIMTSKH